MNKPPVNSHDRNAPLPQVGSRWVWEIEASHARQLVEVESVDWNGEEWWVVTSTLPGASERVFDDQRLPKRHHNDLSRFWEASTPVGGRREDLTQSRSGGPA